MCLTAGQVSDYKGAETLFNALSAAKHLLTDRGYDAYWFKDGLRHKGKGSKNRIPNKCSLNTSQDLVS